MNSDYPFGTSLYEAQQLYTGHCTVTWQLSSVSLNIQYPLLGILLLCYIKSLSSVVQVNL